MALFGMSREEMVSTLAEAIERAVVELDEDGRYLLIIPEVTDQKVVDEAIAYLEKALDVKNSNLRIAFLSHPNIRMIEF